MVGCTFFLTPQNNRFSQFLDNFLLPGISRQQTIFLSDLRFSVQWFHGSMVICDCSAVQSAVCLSKCLTAAPVFLLGATRHFVLLSCKICAEIVVYRMLAVFLNGLNGKNNSRSIVWNIFSVYFFYAGFKISYSEYSFVIQIVILVNQDCKLHK